MSDLPEQLEPPLQVTDSWQCGHVAIVRDMLFKHVTVQKCADTELAFVRILQIKYQVWEFQPFLSSDVRCALIRNRP